MSGFVGIFQRDGAPLAAGLLERMTASLRFRGPDGELTWQAGPVGLGHSLLAAANGPTSLPLALGQEFWITGDIRLDARVDLVQALEAAHAPASSSDADPVLVLLAYRAWGPDCVKHLAGDFSFAIWDAPRQRLFCARDPFGTRPFFYALTQGFIAFSNTLHTLRAHPRVGAHLDESAIADFLVFGMQLDPAASTFTDIRRLPGGACLLVDARTAEARPYYALPTPGRLRYRDSHEYLEHFRQVLTRAVADRCPAQQPLLQLSGGIDSAAIGAALTGRFGPWHAPGGLRAVCTRWNSFFPDPEAPLAQASASALGIPLELWDREDCEPHDAGEAGSLSAPEPGFALFRAGLARDTRKLSQMSGVVLNGQGGDELFCRELLADELRATGELRLLADALKAWPRFGRPPLGLRAALGSLLGASEPQALARVPAWLNPDWARRLGLAERVRAFNARLSFPARISRGSARVRLANIFWQRSCEEMDAFNTGATVQTRWPFLDQRVVSFVLSLPPYPWCVDKALMRAALAPLLPAEVTRRPKTPLQADPLLIHLHRNPDWRGSYQILPARMEPWIDREAWRGACQAWSPDRDGSDTAWAMGRLTALRLWLERG